MKEFSTSCTRGRAAGKELGMAAIFKHVYTKRDPKTGKRVSRKTRKWYVKYRDAKGVTRKVPGYTDKDATRKLAADLEQRAAREHSGLTDRFEQHRRCSITNHVDAFEIFLLARGNTQKHVQLKISRVRTVLEACSIRTIPGLSASAVSEWIDEKRRSGLSAQTLNHYLTSVKGFTRWLVMEGRAPDNPFTHLKALNVKADCRVERRALSSDEFERLLMAASDGEPFRGISGLDRARLYVVAAYTGLRCSELASLTPESFDFDSCPLPSVTVKAAYAKNREESVLPLRSDVAELIRRWIDSLPRYGQIWPGTWNHRAAKMIRADLEAAGIPYKDAAGRVFDFHALRHHFLSTLAKTGTHPKTAQALARHSTIALTMDRYTHLARLDTSNALEALPSLDDGTRSALFTGEKARPELGPQLGPTAGTLGQEMTSGDKGKPKGGSGSGPSQRAVALRNASEDKGLEVASPAGLEPAAYGLGNRRCRELSGGVV